jgi:hypothetical protein
MLTLRDVPDPKNADFWDHSDGSEGGSMNIIVWPADDGAKLVRVRVGLMALGDYDGHALGINSVEIKAALTRHCDLIQQLARAKYRAGDDAVTLDVGDFPAPLPLLPIPTSGQTRIGPLSRKEFLIECAGFNKPDHDRLMGFFNQMMGRFGAFRFQYGTISYPRCHFGSDELPLEQIGHNVYRVRFSIEVVSKR